jgi:hypothetical protein
MTVELLIANSQAALANKGALVEEESGSGCHY